MRILFVVLLAIVSLCQAIAPHINKDAAVKVHGTVIQKSCMDYLKEGATHNGFYLIKIAGRTLTVYCDFRSEPGMAWTLVMSWSLENKNLPAFRNKPITMNSPVNENNPNLNIYRLTLANTAALKAQSTHWRATCSFHEINDAQTLYTDYIRGKFADFDIMSFNGQGVCKRVEYVNIRRQSGYHTVVRFWQAPNGSTLHTDSSSSGCSYVASAGSVSSEDNFGYYYTTNKKFRCTSNQGSTTNWWFGGYL